MLSTHALDFSIEKKTILQSISLSVKPGELWVLLGPNGAGKSTLLNALAGEVESLRAQVRLGERALSEYSLRELAYYRAVMPQSVHLDFAFLVEEVVAMGLLGARAQTIPDLVAEALTLFDVPHLAQRNYLTLSGGEQQRVQLARVVAQSLLAVRSGCVAEHFLLLDECTSSLDLAHQQQVFKVFKRLCADYSIGILAVLHDLNLASQFADKALLLSNGACHAMGAVSEVLTQTNIEQVYRTPVEVIRREQAWSIIVPRG